jgi:hypothetical protein
MNRLSLLVQRLVAPALVLAGLSLGSTSAHAFNPLDACEPVWSTQPSRYHINENGYSQMPLQTVRDLFAQGMDAWSAPCCSSWSAVEAGLTTGVGEDARNNQNIVSFREDSWPSNLGDPNAVLAVTLTRFGYDRSGRCTALTADMVYNAARNTFANTGAGRNIDFLAVTTHEQGHWLGLDHSTVSGSTMQPTYFGEGGRSLHPDDEEGVCYLYNRECSCSSDDECFEGEQCIGSTCVVPPCLADSDCAEGLECNSATGDCFVPPCTSDDDCPGVQVCDAGTCRLESDCSICAACSSVEDCGGSQFICASAGGPNFCTRICSSTGDCPGNSDCFDVPGEDFAVCLNDNINTGGLCPDDYICTTSDGDPCDGVTCGAGQTCNPRTGACIDAGGTGGGDCNMCGPCTTDSDCGNGYCLSFDGVSTFCAPVCTNASECPANGDCFQIQIQGGGSTSNAQVCLNEDADTAGTCPDGFVCEPRGDVTPADPCDGVTCGAGQTCDPNSGRCVDQDEVVTPPVGECTVCDSCGTDTDCGAGSRCINLGNGNVCSFECDGSNCAGNVGCFEVGDGQGGTVNLCLNADAGEAGICPARFTCELTSNVPDDGGSDTDGGAGGGGTNNGGTDEGGTTSSNGSSGCQAARRGSDVPASGALIALAALTLAGRRRRKSAR